MRPAVITIPAFTTTRKGAHHFFGTKHASVGQEGDGGEARWINRIVPALQTVGSVKQVHGTDVLVLDRPVEGHTVFQEGWDALVTNQPGVLLTVRTADCVPVLIHDPVRDIVAAVHAGWRGAVAGIVSNTLEVMRARFGSEPTSMQVGIGPSVGMCCYEVDAPVLDRLQAGYAEWPSVVQTRNRGKAMLNLRALVRGQARQAGIPDAQISTVSLCTVCHQDLFYSYRREGNARKTMLSGIMLSRRRASARRSRGKRRVA